MVVKTFGSCLSVACGSTTSVVARTSAATEAIQKTPMMISCLPIDRLLLDTGSILYIPTKRDVAARGYPNDRRMLPLRLRPARHCQRSALPGVRPARRAQPAHQRRASRHAATVASNVVAWRGHDA